MLTAGTLALLFDIEILAELVSIGTLVVFAMVCSGDPQRADQFCLSPYPLSKL